LVNWQVGTGSPIYQSTNYQYTNLPIQEEHG
jgi:hypothetical protein